ncbi:MAG: hypothetical protein OEW42_05660 [Acidimicrobiia bacterium]|nr:hypothetical protein [Acidimicrobiia bacterium]MDH5236076.1 hypothetical protein [Acidimicrobiia bacterium]
MNHGQLAAEALRFRLDTLQPSMVDPARFDLERAADVAACSADPVIDSAIRTIGCAWIAAGLPRDDLTRSWDQPAVRELFGRRPDLIDALDDIVRQVCRLAPCT